MVWQSGVLEGRKPDSLLRKAGATVRFDKEIESRPELGGALGTKETYLPSKESNHSAAP